MKYILLLMVLLVIPFAYADEIEQEADDFAHRTGAEVRLLQLEKDLERNILQGETVLVYLNESVEEAEALLFELKDIQEQVTQLVPEATPEAAAAFVELKKSAKNVSASFKSLVGPLLSEEDREAIRAEIMEEVEQIREEKQQMVSQRVREHNMNRFAQLLNRLNASNPELVARFENSNATPQDLAAYLRSEMANKSQEMRQEFARGLQEQRREFVESIKERREEMHNQMMQRRDALREDFMQKRQELRQNVMERRDRFFDSMNHSQMENQSMNETAPMRDRPPRGRS